MVLDFLQECSLSAYPFKVSSVVPNNVLLDLQVVLHNPYSSCVLTSIVSDGTTATFTFTLSTVVLEVVGAASLDTGAWLTASNSQASIRLTVGEGYASFLSTILDLQCSLEVHQSCLIPATPAVSTVILTSKEAGGGETSFSFTSEEDVVLREGTNVQLGDTWQVDKGLGAGLYNNCTSDLLDSTVVKEELLDSYGFTDCSTENDISLGEHEAGKYRVVYKEGAYRYSGYWTAGGITVVGSTRSVCPHIQADTLEAAEKQYAVSRPFFSFQHNGGEIKLRVTPPTGATTESKPPVFELRTETTVAQYTKAVSPLRSINQVKGTDDGRFQLKTDLSCVLKPGDGFVVLHKPVDNRCKSTDYRALARYMNRVSDAVGQIGIKAAETELILVSTYSQLKEEFEAKAKFRPPYLKADHKQQDYLGVKYANVGLMIHIPDKEVNEGSLQLLLGSALQLSGNSQLVVDGIVMLQPNGPGFDAMSLKCKNSMLQRFTLKTPLVKKPHTAPPDYALWVNDGFTTNYDLNCLLTHNKGQSYFLLPLFVTTPHFTVSVLVQKDEGKFYSRFEFCFLDPQQRQLATVFNCPLPPGLKIKQGTLKLLSNNETVDVPRNLQHAPGWGFTGLAAQQGPALVLTLDLSKKTKLVFDADWLGDPCTDQPAQNAVLPITASLFAGTDIEDNTFQRTFQVQFA